MKIARLALVIGLVFLSHAAAQEATPSPSPSPRNQFGATKKNPSAKARDTDDDATPTPTPHSTKKKTTKKAIHAGDSDDEGTPTPKPLPTSTSLTKQSQSGSAPDASLDGDDLVEFARQPARVRKLIESALALTKLNLTYTYGSDDPQNGGMDCSGFIYYVLRENGFDDVPRDASGQYVWVRKAKTFQAVLSARQDTFELDDLRPGDLLFWVGTYDVKRDPPVTHTMIYLGTEKATHQPVMVGATDGRSYHGKSRWGVSVFDFKANLPAQQAVSEKKTHALFVGYARIPGLRPE